MEDNVDQSSTLPFRRISFRSQPEISSDSVAADHSTSRPSTPSVRFAGVGDGLQAPKPTTVQFTNPTRSSSSSGSPAMPAVGAPRGKTRNLSPPPAPPPPKFNSRVSFDLFANKSTENPSFTMISQHRDYERKRGSRTYLCGTDESDYAAFALKYLIKKLVDDGDDIVCVRAVDKDSEVASEFSIKETEYRQKAQKVQEQVQAMLDSARGPAVKVVIEFAVGKVGDTIDRMVNIHHPLCVVVGTRGKSLAGSGFGKTSTSQYLCQHSPVPVIIVRPEHKRLKNLRKRESNPERREYKQLMGRSSPTDLPLGEAAADRIVQEASDDERKAVAKAIGLSDKPTKLKPLRGRSGSRGESRERPASIRSTGSGAEESSEEEEEGAPLSRMSSNKSEIDSDYDSGDEGPDLEDMPNFIPGLGDSGVGDVEDRG